MKQMHGVDAMQKERDVESGSTGEVNGVLSKRDASHTWFDDHSNHPAGLTRVPHPRTFCGDSVRVFLKARGTGGTHVVGRLQGGVSHQPHCWGSRGALGVQDAKTETGLDRTNTARGHRAGIVICKIGVGGWGGIFNVGTKEPCSTTNAANDSIQIERRLAQFVLFCFVRFVLFCVFVFVRFCRRSVCPVTNSQRSQTSGTIENEARR